jgi:hypothetical protein
MLQVQPLVAVRDPAEIDAASPLVRDLAERSTDCARTLDLDLPKESTSPLGPIHLLLQRLQGVRGYFAYDVQRYREYLQILADEKGLPVADTGFRTLRVAHRSLLDLLGVRYLLRPASEAVGGASSDRGERTGWKTLLGDPRPMVYVFTGRGLTTVPPYVLDENLKAMPRAFVVPASAQLPPGEEARVALTSNDFRRRVYLEDLSAGSTESGSRLATAGSGTFTRATIRSHQPDRVVIDVAPDAPGWLVLTDVWSPQWKCTVDGESTDLFRANYAFRAARVGAGNHEVVFQCEPRMFYLGRKISLGTCLVVAILLGWFGFREKKRDRGLPMGMDGAPEVL